jgi:hypothetical protein
MRCEFIGDAGKTWRDVTCARCGRRVRSPHSTAKVYATCPAWPRWWELGHWAEFALAVLGINQDRWNWIRFRLGFTTPCGCDGKIVKLNESGGWLRDRLDVIGRLFAVCRLGTR